MTGSLGYFFVTFWGRPPESFWVTFLFLNRVQQHVSGNTSSHYSPDSVSWTLFWCSPIGSAVSSKQCLQTLPCQILETPSAGHCLGAHWGILGGSRGNPWVSHVGCTSRGSRNNTFLRRVLRRFFKSGPLPTLQSETWLVHAKVREPHLNPLVRMNFPGFSL